MVPVFVCDGTSNGCEKSWSARRLSVGRRPGVSVHLLGGSTQRGSVAGADAPSCGSHPDPIDIHDEFESDAILN